MGQINLVQEAIPFIKEKGSFTLVSGILNDEPIFAGVAASTVSGALEAFVRAAAIELPKGLRINVVSPTMLKESESQFAQFFIGMIPVEGWKVGQAYKRAILGAQTGRVLEAAGEGTILADHFSPTFRPAFPSSAIISERSSPSRVRFAAPNNGAPLTAPGRSEQHL